MNLRDLIKKAWSITKKVLAVLLLILGFIYFIGLVYEGGSLFGVTNLPTRLVLASMTVFGWLRIVQWATKSLFN